ncbi:hypothetical protein [Breoghania sp.]|uniref:hypothetical protein n=1 Tax=Breoghania sp. TaxID=2065378 RepID=UPI002AA769BC|nr:hypothetical protein [Breoghania sp.]
MSKHNATPEEIRDSLEEDIKTNAITLNGMLVFNHRDLPHDFPELMTEVLQKRFEEVGERYGVPDASDLYIVADGAEARWYVMSKSTRMPVGSAPITAQSLAAVREEHRKAETDAYFAERAARVEFWRRAAEERHWARQSVARWAYEALRDSYDEDYTDYQQRLRDSLLTPHERAERHREIARKRLKTFYHDYLEQMHSSHRPLHKC